MINLAEKQVNTKVIFDISLFNKCFDVIEKLYTTGAENTQTDTQRAYICQVTKNTIIVKENKKAGKQIATFPKKEVFEYLGSKLVDTTKNKVDTTPSQRDTTNTKLDTTKNKVDTTKINVDTTPSQEKKNEIYKSSLTPSNQYQVTHANHTKIDVSNFAIDLHKAGFCVVSNILPPAYQKIETQTESQVKEIFSKPNANELHLLLTKNLFCIDVDLKVFETSQDKDNFLEMFKSALISFGIDFYEKLVIESTKSKGVHFYFYAPDLQAKKSVDKNLAYYKTKPLIEFLKVKVTCFPTANYKFIQGNLFNIPTLTNSEFSKLVDTCKGFCDKPKEVPTPTPNKRIYENNNNTDIILDSEIFEFCINVIDKKRSFAPGNTNDYLINLIHFCNKKGVPKDYVLFECQNRFITDKVKSKDIASKVNSIYNNYTHEHNKEPYNKPFEKSKQVQEPNNTQKQTISKKQPTTKENKESAKNSKESASKTNFSEKVQKTLDFLNAQNIYKNSITEITHIQERIFCTSEQNTYFLECKNMFGISKEDYFALINSTKIHQNNSVLNFINKTTPTNSTTIIRSVFDSIVLKNNEHKEMLYNIFVKFFIGVFVRILDTSEQNELFLILVGDNNIGKTRFLKSLFLEFEEVSTISNDSQNMKIDNIIRQGTNNVCLIFEEITKNFFNENTEPLIRLLLANKAVNIVQKFANKGTNLDIKASFLGTSNYTDLISSDKNRRIIPIEIKDLCFDIFEDKTNIFNFWNEIYNLYLAKKQYWLNDNEINFVKDILTNKFKEVSFVENLILEKIRPAEDTDTDFEYMQASTIQTLLATNNIPTNKLGMYLIKAKFVLHHNKKDKNGKILRNCYKVVKNN